MIIKNRTSIECAVCHRPDTRPLQYNINHSGQFYDLYRCSSCGFAKTEPIPDRSQRLALYSSDTYRDHGRRFISAVECVIRWFSRAKLKRVQKTCPGGRLLDIGCGRGLVLAMARAKGWETYGLEFNDETAFHARHVLGLDVRTGGIADAGFKHGTFDVITAWHVLEHLDDPVGTITECFKLLKPGGVLILAVPNLQSLQAQMTGKYWFHLDIPYHLYHFSTQSVKVMLETYSFRIEHVSHFSLEQNPFGFLQSLLNATIARRNLLYDILKTRHIKDNGTGGRYYFDLFMTLVLTLFAAPLSFVLSCVESMIGRGGTIEVYAKKAGV